MRIFFNIIFWLVLTLEISYNRVIIYWRILVSFRGFFEDYIFASWNILGFFFFFSCGTITRNWTHSYIYIYRTRRNRRFFIKAGKNRQHWVGTTDGDDDGGRLGKPQIIKFGGMMMKRQSCIDPEGAADTYLHRESLSSSSSDALPDGWMDGCIQQLLMGSSRWWVICDHNKWEERDRSGGELGEGTKGSHQEEAGVRRTRTLSGGERWRVNAGLIACLLAATVTCRFKKTTDLTRLS
jgi:hypothetical protein